MRLIFCLLFMLSFQSFADDEQAQAKQTSGEGVILEFEHNEDDYAKEEKQESNNDKRTSGIEMIVGGQGENGIAKRKQLQVID